MKNVWRVGWGRARARERSNDRNLSTKSKNEKRNNIIEFTNVLLHHGNIIYYKKEGTSTYWSYPSLYDLLFLKTNEKSNCYRSNVMAFKFLSLLDLLSLYVNCSLIVPTITRPESLTVSWHVVVLPSVFYFSLMLCTHYPIIPPPTTLLYFGYILNHQMKY